MCSYRRRNPRSASPKNKKRESGRNQQEYNQLIQRVWERRRITIDERTYIPKCCDTQPVRMEQLGRCDHWEIQPSQGQFKYSFKFTTIII